MGTDTNLATQEILLPATVNKPGPFSLAWSGTAVNGTATVIYLAFRTNTAGTLNFSIETANPIVFEI